MSVVVCEQGDALGSLSWDLSWICQHKWPAGQGRSTEGPEGQNLGTNWIFPSLMGHEHNHSHGHLWEA